MTQTNLCWKMEFRGYYEHYEQMQEDSFLECSNVWHVLIYIYFASMKMMVVSMMIIADYHDERNT